MARRQFKRLLFESPSVASGEERELVREDFEFERRLGDGAFGQVWRAKHKVTGQQYAVKQVSKEKVMKMLPQFKREVRIMYEMSHQHIIKLYNHFEDDQNFYLIMELADSNLYSQLNREKQFLERVAAQYFREAVLAVEYLHSHAPPIIHRDIKPENILIDRVGRIKLTDFGWSNYSNEANLRQTLCGTMEYLPPEMVAQTGHDTSADIWCLGVLLFEMLAGYTPFKSNDNTKLLANITKAKPRFPLSFPQQAKELVTKMLNKHPDARPNITQVKEHRWLTEQPPIRETLTQSLEITPLPDSEETPNKGYVVISKHTEQTPVISSVRKQRQSSLIPELAEKSARLSEVKYQETIQKLNIETKSIRQEIARIEGVIVSRRSLVDSLTAAISQKSSENRQLGTSERELLENIALLNAELEKVHRLDHTHQINEEIQKVQQMTFETQASLTRKQALLASHLQEFKRKSEQVKNLEHQISTLNSQLSSYKSDLLQADREPKVTELHLQADILRTRLLNFERLNRPLSASDATVAESIIESMNIRVKSIKGLEEDEMQERIESLEASVRQLENKMSQTSFEYEEEKSRVKATLMAKKEEIMSKANSIKLQKEAAIRQAASEEKTALHHQISLLQQHSQVDTNELLALKKQTEQLQTTARQETERVCELLRRRETLHREAELQQKKIEETEIELGLLKGRVFAMGLVDL